MPWREEGREKVNEQWEMWMKIDSVKGQRREEVNRWREDNMLKKSGGWEKG